MTKESPNNRPQAKLIFFLGGRDLEMATIRDLLDKHARGRWHDKQLSWGNAKASSYRDEIDDTIAAGGTPVLIELEDDLGLSTAGDQEGDRANVIRVDHHGPRAGSDRPTSLHQIFTLLNIDPVHWESRFDLIAANDRGYIPAMTELGASREEITEIRLADRAAQGITPEQEAQGEKAILNAQLLAGGRLTMVALPHDRTAVVADRVTLERPDASGESLFILGQDAVHYFGRGSLVLALNDAFPDGWYGGALPGRGFWGHKAPAHHALAFLLDRLSSTSTGK
jgi:hypothetical protein